MTPIETVALRTLLWASVGTAAAVPVLFLPAPGEPLLTIVIHLGVLAVYAAAMTFHLAPLADTAWFHGVAMAAGGRQALTWVMVVFDISGAAAVTSLTTSAALRYHPSLQLLQVVSVMVTSGAIAATILGARRRWGGAGALVAAGIIGLVCVWVMWRHLDTVGFTASGGWRVDGAAVRETVVPYLAGVLVVSGTLFAIGVRGRG